MNAKGKRLPQNHGLSLLSKSTDTLIVSRETPIVKQKGVREMANELQEMRTSQNIPAKDMVDVVRELYPRFDKPLLSKCQHHELYGIDLREDAMEALRQKYPVQAVATVESEAVSTGTGKPAKRDTHRLSHRIQCRLEDDEYISLLRFVRDDGHDTMQSWLVQVVRRYIRRRAEKEKHCLI